MTNRFSTPVLLACIAFGVSCGSDRSVAPAARPPRLPVFNTLEVQPTAADIFSLPPGNTIALTIVAWDETRTPIRETAPPTFSSSATAIAEVSSSGLVTAVAPGTAVITSTLTIGGVTRTASMTATVRRRDEAPNDYPEMGGIYDLTALITNSDPAWGIPDGTRQTAVLTIYPSRGASRFAGAFSAFRATAPNGEYGEGNPGSVEGSIDHDGQVVIELFFEGSRSSYWYGKGLLDSGRIVGKFGAGGHISGTFTAERRQPQ